MMNDYWSYLRQPSYMVDVGHAVQVECGSFFGIQDDFAPFDWQN